MRRTNCAALGLLLVGAIALGACGDKSSPAAPTPPPPPSNPPAPTVTNLSIDGYAPILRVGQSVQLRATATFSNGSTQDVTSTATWSVSNSAVASLFRGLLSGRGVGEADVTAASGSVVVSAHIVVREPASLEEISGVVHEVGARATLTLPDVRVEISGGPHHGMAVMTDRDGRFDLPDLFEPGIELWAFRRGYENTRFRVVVLRRDKVADIAMPPMALIVEQTFSGTLGPCDIAGDRARGLRFTPHRDGVLRVEEYSNTAFEAAMDVYRGSTVLNWFNANGRAYDVLAGVEHELRVFGYCFPSFSVSFRVKFTRPD